MNKFNGWLLTLASFILPLALYVRTLAPTYIPIDSAEFALCMHFWGICHPPGFPLYIFLGKIFTTYFPIGTVIYKANLLSAIFGAGTILFVYLTLSLLKVNRVLALLVSLILAVSQTFWEFSIAADVFTFATFLIALTFFLVFGRRFYLAVFALGISASHFYISAVLLPFLIWYFLAGTSHRSYKSYMSNSTKAALLLLLSGVFLLGFFPQALMFLRIQENPVINWGHAQGLGGFIDFIRRKEFGNIFLLANPVLQFSILKFFRHIWAFTLSFLTNFGVILPILILPAAVFARLYQNRLYILLFVSFLVLILVQLFLLSTIDPLEEDSPFEISKFYLSAFIPATLLMGISLQKLTERIFEGHVLYPALFAGVLLFIYLAANYKQADLANNYFSQNMVLDALEQLPQGSVAITVSHIFNFGAKYEQLVNQEFKDIQILYSPNEKNRDSEKYYPDLFSGNIDNEFSKKISSNKDLGNAERYILETISKNSDKPIYILQGDFEERFFLYLKPFIRPYGLWWRVEPDISIKDDLVGTRGPLIQLRNDGVKYADVHFKQQRDLLGYAVSYHSMGVMLASYQRYEEAVEFLKKSLEVGPDNENVRREIELINETGDLDLRLEALIGEKNREKLAKLGNNLFILMNFRRCEEVFEALINLGEATASNFNNLASCQASYGKILEARQNYEKALELDPKLEKAKKGLEALE